ncbi:MAG: hypothetical protein JNN04_15380 [Cyclobacteriaceae bacterium]|nr:hypothetical protein [Cyclobacteriaceae bacterium]
MIRKYTSLFLVALLLVHLAGFYVYFVVRLGDLRMSMREKIALLPSEQLEVVRIPAASFRSHWINEREMEWQGKMYDIARVEKQGAEVLVYALHDQDEDGLINFLTAVVDMARQDPQPAPSTVVQFFTLKFVINQEIAVAPILTHQANPATFISAFPSSPTLDHLTPPPRA